MYHKGTKKAFGKKKTIEPPQHSGIWSDQNKNKNFVETSSPFDIDDAPGWASNSRETQHLAGLYIIVYSIWFSPIRQTATTRISGVCVSCVMCSCVISTRIKFGVNV